MLVLKVSGSATQMIIRQVRGVRGRPTRWVFCRWHKGEPAFEIAQGTRVYWGQGEYGPIFVEALEPGQLRK